MADASAQAAATRSPAMPFILITVLIDMVGIGLIVPVLPLIVGTFTASPSEQAYWFGAVTLTFGLANFVASPVLGALSDRYGRRPVLLMGFTGMAISFVVTGLATALWMLIAVRLVSGATQANAAVANAYVADITPPPPFCRAKTSIEHALGKLERPFEVTTKSHARGRSSADANGDAIGFATGAGGDDGAIRRGRRGFPGTLRGCRS